MNKKIRKRILLKIRILRYFKKLYEKQNKRNIFNEINELSLYVAEYITLVNKILNIYFKNNIITSIILSCLENTLKIQYISYHRMYRSHNYL